MTKHAWMTSVAVVGLLLSAAGIDRVVFSIASEDKDKTLATLDRLAAAMRQTG